jgi:hypothetical protein
MEQEGNGLDWARLLSENEGGGRERQRFLVCASLMLLLEVEIICVTRQAEGAEGLRG